MSDSPRSFAENPYQVGPSFREVTDSAKRPRREDDVLWLPDGFEFGECCLLTGAEQDLGNWRVRVFKAFLPGRSAKIRFRVSSAIEQRFTTAKRLALAASLLLILSFGTNFGHQPESLFYWLPILVVLEPLIRPSIVALLESYAGLHFTIAKLGRSEVALRNIPETVIRRIVPPSDAG